MLNDITVLEDNLNISAAIIKYFEEIILLRISVSSVLENTETKNVLLKKIQKIFSSYKNDNLDIKNIFIREFGNFNFIDLQNEYVNFYISPNRIKTVTNANKQIAIGNTKYLEDFEKYAIKKLYTSLMNFENLNFCVADVRNISCFIKKFLVKTSNIFYLEKNIFCSNYWGLENQRNIRIRKFISRLYIDNSDCYEISREERAFIAETYLFFFKSTLINRLIFYQRRYTIKKKLLFDILEKFRLLFLEFCIILKDINDNILLQNRTNVTNFQKNINVFQIFDNLLTIKSKNVISTWENSHDVFYHSKLLDKYIFKVIFNKIIPFDHRNKILYFFFADLIEINFKLLSKTKNSQTVLKVFDKIYRLINKEIQKFEKV